jgi:hypothetical protein
MLFMMQPAETVRFETTKPLWRVHKERIKPLILIVIHMGISINGVTPKMDGL